MAGARTNTGSGGHISVDALRSLPEAGAAFPPLAPLLPPPPLRFLLPPPPHLPRHRQALIPTTTTTATATLPLLPPPPPVRDGIENSAMLGDKMLIATSLSSCPARRKSVNLLRCRKKRRTAQKLREGVGTVWGDAPIYVVSGYSVGGETPRGTRRNEIDAALAGSRKKRR